MPLQQNILKTLSYFDIFHYPLLATEIREYLPEAISLQELQQELDAMQYHEMIFKLDEFYALRDDLFLAIRRRNGNRLAATELTNAAKAARRLFKFPFVKGLAISGSLSKNYADENTDIDFFIITQTNRLWIARTLMHVFFKWALFTKQDRLYCMNYYIDESAMEIPEQNIFTAMEIITLIPAAGTGCVEGFMQANKWTATHFPLAVSKNALLQKSRKGIAGFIAEKILSGKLGNYIDNRLFKMTARHWQQKKSQLKINAKGICTGMLAGKHFAKPDPKNFQYKILSQYENRLKNIDYILHKRHTAFSWFSSAAK